MLALRFYSWMWFLKWFLKVIQRNISGTDTRNLCLLRALRSCALDKWSDYEIEWKIILESHLTAPIILMGLEKQYEMMMTHLHTLAFGKKSWASGKLSWQEASLYHSCHRREKILQASLKQSWVVWVPALSKVVYSRLLVRKCNVFLLERDAAHRVRQKSLIIYLNQEHIGKSNGKSSAQWGIRYFAISRSGKKAKRYTKTEKRGLKNHNNGHQIGGV